MRYTPDAGFSGTDTVTYTVADAHRRTSTGELVVQVDVSAEPGRAGGAVIDHLVVYQGSSVSFTAADLLANDVDPEAGLRWWRCREPDGGRGVGGVGGRRGSCSRRRTGRGSWVRTSIWSIWWWIRMGMSRSGDGADPGVGGG